MALTSKTVAKVTTSGDVTSDDIAISLDFQHSYSDDLTNGSSSGNCNIAWNDTRTLGAGATENLDLAGGLTRGGYTYTFTAVQTILIEVTTTDTLTVGNTAATQFVGPFGAATHTITIPVGGCALFHHGVAGWTVTGGSADLLLMTAGASGCTYEITIVGIGTKA